MGDGQRVAAVDVETNPCDEISLPPTSQITINGTSITVANVHVWTIIPNPIFVMNIPVDPLADVWQNYPGDQKAQAFAKAMRGLKLLKQEDVKEAASLVSGFTSRYNTIVMAKNRAEKKHKKLMGRDRPKYDRRAICSSSMKGKSYNGR